MKKILTCILALALMTSLSGCSNPKDSTISYTEGTYESTQKGMNGDVVVSVTFTQDAISEITVVKHSETDGLSDAPISQIPAEIVEYQSLAVDVITGATKTSNAIISAVCDAVVQADGDLEALKNKEIINNNDNELIEKTADVVVVGSGSAGLSAAVAAAQGGKSVVLIETNAYLGGNTVRTGGGTIIVDPESMPKKAMTDGQFAEITRLVEMEVSDEFAKSWQEIVKEDIKSYISGEKTGMYDSVELTALNYYFNNDFLPNTQYLYNLFDKSLSDKIWLEDMGFSWSKEPTILVGHNWPRMYFSTEHKGGNGFIEVFTNHIEEENLPVEIITQVKGEEIIMQDNKAVGINAISSKGQPYKLMANNAVVIATGGFGANPEMLAQYSNGQFDNIENMSSTNDSSIQGDGINMATKIGAQVVGMGSMQVLPIADPENGDTKTIGGSSTGLYVNKEGLRFVDESENRNNMVAAISKQTDSQYYVISSEENNGIDADGYNMMGLSLENLLESGKVIKADTIAQLAEKISIDPATLQTTIDKFNIAATTNVDAEFGRIIYNPDFVNEGASLVIGEGPYYACLRSPAVHITKGGILIDESSRVLDENNEQISGLYAAGETTGGMYMKGLGHSIYTGKIAGETIVNDYK